MHDEANEQTPADPLLRSASDSCHAEAGERIRASEAHVYRLIEDGELRAVDIAVPGSSRQKTRLRSDDLDAYIERRTRNPESPT